VELEQLRLRMAGVKNERAVKIGELSQLVMEISNALVDLGMSPIWDIPQLLKSALEVLAVTELGPTAILVSSGYPPCHFFVFLFLSSCNIYIHTPTHILKLMTLHPCVLVSPAAMSQGPRT
jgi:hypothetical protein